MDRIAIIGCSGAGKSTLSGRLGQRLNIPVVHLDRLFWQPGWVESPRPQFEQRVRDAVQRDRWIIDGTFIATQHIIMPRADTVIWLDFPRSICMWRVLRRLWDHRGRQVRADMPQGCGEKLDFEFLEFIWTFREQYRPKIIARLRQCRPDQRLIILRTPADVEHFANEQGVACNEAV